jgi:hypothetical protein
MWTYIVHQTVQHRYFALNYAETYRTTELTIVCPSNSNALLHAEKGTVYYPDKEDKSGCRFDTRQPRKRARHSVFIVEHVYGWLSNDRNV